MGSPRKVPLLGSLFRHLLQRYGRADLPCRHAKWSDLFAPANDYAQGIFHARRAYSGLLQTEAGSSFQVSPSSFTSRLPAVAAVAEDRSYLTKEPDRRIYALAEAGVLGDQGAVFDPQTRTVLRETLEGWETAFGQNAALSSPRLARATRIPGISFLLGGAGVGTFYHFLVEGLPKLYAARRYLDACDRVLVPDGGREWKLRWLDRLGVAAKVTWLSPHAHLRCDQLIFTNRFVRHFEPNPWAVKILRDFAAVAGEEAPPDKVIWLDRRHEATRMVDWEDELLRRLSGVEAVNFAELGLEEGISLCRRAKVVMGFHGGAFANTVFCRAGTRVLEIQRIHSFPWYPRLSQVCGHSHQVLLLDQADIGPAEAAAAVRGAMGQRAPEI